MGIWIVGLGATAWGRPELEYRGLDRLPDLPGPDQDADLRKRGRGRLLEIRNEFWDLEDTRDLHRDPEAALRLSGALNVEGFSVEVILAELIPGNDLSGVPADLRSSYEEHLGQWVIETPIDTGTTRPLGIDVTYPLPTFHSAIRQPTLSNIEPELIDELNDFGLFSAVGVAQHLADRGNRRDTSWRPLCAVKISLVEAASGD
jgi:hypothetical protein